jgi:hypothetical protein
MTDKQRLVNEWLEHDKIVLAVDFDDTIFHWRHTSKEKCSEVIKLVRWVQSIGAYIMIHTSSDKDRYPEITEYCKKNGIHVDSINENPVKMPYGNEGKPYYNWQLCDRSGLTYALIILEDAAKEVLTAKRKSKNLKEIS